MVKFSAFADEVSDGFREQVKFLSWQDVKFLEIRFLNGKNVMDLDKKELADVKRMLDDNEIRISAIGSPVGKIELDKPFAPHFDLFRHAVELAEFFHSPFIRVFSYYAPGGGVIDDYREEVLIRFEKKLDWLKGSTIILVHENESHIYGHSPENCVDLVKTLNSPNLKLAYDPANFVWGEQIPNNVEVCWPLMKTYVIHVHIKDWKLGSKDIGSMPGEGDGQIIKLLAELVSENYDGFITMEPHLKTGGRFGGETGPELFALAIQATKTLCDWVGLKYE